MVLDKISKTKRNHHTLLKVVGGVAGFAMLAAPMVMGLAGVIDMEATVPLLVEEGNPESMLARTSRTLSNESRKSSLNPLVRYGHYEEREAHTPRPRSSWCKNCFQKSSLRSGTTRKIVRGRDISGTLPLKFPIHEPTPRTLARIQEFQGEDYTLYKSRKREELIRKTELKSMISGNQNPTLSVPSHLILDALRPNPSLVSLPTEEILDALPPNPSLVPLPESVGFNRAPYQYSDRLFDAYVGNMSSHSPQAISENKYMDALFDDEIIHNYGLSKEFPLMNQLNARDIRRGRDLMTELQIHRDPQLLSKINTLDKRLSQRCRERCCGVSLALLFGLGIPFVTISSIVDAIRQRD